MTCLDGHVNRTTNVLEYGTFKQFGGITCTSLQTGLTCQAGLLSELQVTAAAYSTS